MTLRRDRPATETLDRHISAAAGKEPRIGGKKGIEIQCQKWFASSTTTR